MDHANRFESRTTYRLLRAEYGVALIACGGLLVTHWHAVRVLPAILLFAYIDLIGYLPGALAFRRAGGRRVGRPYYVLYNTMHSFLTQAAVAGLWALLVRPEWALLVLPVHLCGDRAIFGNFLKPFGVPFEPVPVPAFQEFSRVHLDAAVPATHAARRTSGVGLGAR